MQINGITDCLSLIDTINLGRINLDWDKWNIYNSIVSLFFPRNKKNHSSTYNYIDIVVIEKDVKEKYNIIAKDFLLLKENYRNAGQYEWEDAAYRAYMKYNVKSMKWPKKNFIKKPFTWLFGLISGYGTVVWRMLLTCPVIVFLCGLVYISAFKEIFHAPFWTSMYFSAITFLTIGYGDVSPIELNFSAFQTLLTSIEGFFGLFLMSLVTVVVRKVLR